MCNMIINDKVIKEDFTFIVYNVAFSEASGRFTTELVYNRLKSKKIHTEKSRLESIFETWLDCGLIFENANEYIINSIFI